MLKVPLNKKKLTTGALYFNPDVEIIMQSGKTIVANPLEDLRIYPNLGYIFTPRVSGSLGMMSYDWIRQTCLVIVTSKIGYGSLTCTYP